MSTLFIADLHLSEDQPECVQAFLRFTQRQAGCCSQLYILGDLFDAWLGDDDETALIQTVSNALKQLHQAGTQIYFQHGNRDFLLGQSFADRCGMQLLPEYYELDLYGERTLLVHGDQFCLQDVAYQQERAHYRDPQTQQQLLTLPLAQRKALAEKLRQQSMQENASKASYLMDVSLAELSDYAAQHRISQVIHGHTHRPGYHQDSNYRRWVLGCWETSGQVLSINATQIHFMEEKYLNS